jgi:hypothetical protein
MSEQVRKTKIEDNSRNGLTPTEKKNLHDSMKRNEKALERLSKL